MYLTTPLTVIIFGASTLATFVSELNTREDLDPNLPKCGVEVWLGGADLQKARAQSQGFLKDFGAQVFSYTGPGGHVGRKEVTENSCKEGENCDRSFGPKASLDYWKDDENVGDFVLGTWKNTDDTVCNENGFGENCLPFIA